jgi:hypothetical protein
MVVGASATADTSQDRQTTMECTDKSKASGFAVSVAVSLESVTVPPPRYSVLSGPHAPTTGQARSPVPAGRTWPPALLVLCAGIRRFFGSREGRPRRSRRDNIGCRRSWGGARGRWGLASWSVAAAFDHQGKAIGCEPPARDERVCPPGGEPSRVYGYRSFCPLGGRDGFACGETPTSSTSKQR